jgi:hypothetical protein
MEEPNTMTGGNIEHVTSGLSVRTKGFRAQGHPEISVTVGSATLIPEARVFLDFVFEYLRRSKVVLKSDETLAYGYWLTKFVAMESGDLEVWEYNSSATEFVPGATLTLTYWREQHDLCRRVDAEFSPPRPDTLVVVSPAVLEGAPVQGVRYPSPTDMSGWWITADDYTGDVKMLKTEHLYHVTDLRPDLVRYLALPYGFRFDLSNYEDVWLDRKVAEQSAV